MSLFHSKRKNIKSIQCLRQLCFLLSASLIQKRHRSHCSVCARPSHGRSTRPGQATTCLTSPSKGASSARSQWWMDTSSKLRLLRCGSRNESTATSRLSSGRRTRRATSGENSPGSGSSSLSAVIRLYSVLCVSSAAPQLKTSPRGPGGTTSGS